MLDIAYLAEANIEAACIIRDCAWRDLVAVKGAIFSPPFWTLSDAVFRIQYWSIMLLTHGGC